MNSLDQKINDIFAGLVVRKDLVKLVKGNAIVPTYVLEYLLGQYCATSDDENITMTIQGYLSRMFLINALESLTDPDIEGSIKIVFG